MTVRTDCTVDLKQVSSISKEDPKGVENMPNTDNRHRTSSTGVPEMKTKKEEQQK